MVAAAACAWPPLGAASVLVLRTKCWTMTASLAWVQGAWWDGMGSRPHQKDVTERAGEAEGPCGACRKPGMGVREGSGGWEGIQGPEGWWNVKGYEDQEKLSEKQDN